MHYWHDSGSTPSPWRRAGVVTTGVSGGACLISSDYVGGGHRNFELVVQKGDQLWHHWHVAAIPPDGWPGELIATGVKSVGPGCFIQSDYQASGHGNFELVVQRADQLWHFWHWDGMRSGPRPRAAIASGVTGPGCFIQTDSTANGHRNLEALVQQGPDLWHHWSWAGMPQGPWPGAQAVAGVSGRPASSKARSASAITATWRAAVPMLVNGVPGDPRTELVHFFKVTDPAGRAWQRAQTITFQPRSEKVCQLTGELDWESGRFTVNRTQSRFGLGATDLGYPVEHNGALAFFLRRLVAERTTPTATTRTG